ncbi:MAG: 6,7-dimethyl-8-ribityllumazine synthase [bacterium]
MAKIYEGALNAKGLKFGIVVSRFNDFISGRLLDGALDALIRLGAERDAIEVAWVPGAFEAPLAAQKMAMSKRVDAVICLAVIIRGATPHFEYIAGSITRNLGGIPLKTDVPVSFGVITADTIEQAVERAGTKSGNKGADAALAAVEMANLMKQL